MRILKNRLRSSGYGMLAEWIDRRHRVACSQRGNLFAPTKEK
jgi:hypothetical protein